MLNTEELDKLLIEAYWSLRRASMLVLTAPDTEKYLKPSYLLYSNLEIYYIRLANKIIFLDSEKETFFKENIEPHLHLLDDIEAIWETAELRNLYDWAALYGIQIPQWHKKTALSRKWESYDGIMTNLSGEDLVKKNKELG